MSMPMDTPIRVWVVVCTTSSLPPDCVTVTTISLVTRNEKRAYLCAIEEAFQHPNRRHLDAYAEWKAGIRFGEGGDRDDLSNLSEDGWDDLTPENTLDEIKDEFSLRCEDVEDDDGIVYNWRVESHMLN